MYLLVVEQSCTVHLLHVATRSYMLLHRRATFVKLHVDLPVHEKQARGRCWRPKPMTMNLNQPSLIAGNLEVIDDGTARLGSK